MSTRGSASTLAQALKELSLEWQQTKAFWRDVKCQEFERKYINELPAQVTRAAEAIGEIDVLLRKVRNDCE